MSHFREVLIAQFFVDWLRETYGAEFQLVNEIVQDSHIDVHAYATTRGFDDLKIQNVTAGSRVETAPEVPWPHSIREAVMRKDSKFPADVKRELVLLVEGVHPLPSSSRIEQHIRFGDCFDFKGIYLITPHGSTPSAHNDDRSGFVYPIKNALQSVTEIDEVLE